jgi:hypothetical protein
MGLAQIADNPIEGTRDDELDRLPFALRCARLIKAAAGSSPSVVAGLIGPWGSGKTSLLTMVAEQLEKDDTCTVVRFDPWELSDVSSVFAEFFATICSAIGDDEMSRNAITRYAGKIAPQSAVAEQLIGTTSLETLRNNAIESMQRAERRILVLIDDVDRLTGNELTTLLKLVGRVGRLPNISYVLAYDETTVLDVLSNTDVGGQDKHRALSYLDKVVQLRLDLPPVASYRIVEMVNRGLEDLAAAHRVAFDGNDAARIASVYVSCLEPSFTEPRHVKRLFAQVNAFYDLVAGEVDFVDFLLITFLRVFYPAVHREILASKAELTGTKVELTPIPDDERIAQWHRRLETHGLDDRSIERAMGILTLLFRRLKPAGSARGALPQPARSVGTEEYFDRYMYFAIPPDDFADASVAAAIDEVVGGAPGKAARALLDGLDDAADPIVEKLLRFHPDDSWAARMLVPFAAQVAASTPEGNGFTRLTAQRARQWLTELLQQASMVDADMILEDLLEHLSINDVAAAISRAKGEPADARGMPTHLSALSAAVGDALYKQLQEAASRTPAELGVQVPWTLAQWERFAGDAEQSRQWLRRQVDTGSWPAEDVVAMFATVGVREDGVEILTGVNLPGIDQHLGIDWLLSRFTPVGSGPRTGATASTTDTSFDERKRWAHNALLDEAARRDQSQLQTLR